MVDRERIETICKTLAAEHDQLMRLIERIDTADGGDEDESKLAIAGLLESIADHERREQEFVASLLGD